MENPEKNYTDNRNTTDINDKVTEWLAKQFKTQNWNITDMLRTQNATVYLLIWPIMEQNIFKGFMQAKDIVPKSEMMGCYFDEMGSEKLVRYFYDRYQDKDKYKSLVNSKKCYRFMEDVLAKDFEILSGTEKMILMMTVVFRYRNNIFHGNKAIGEWIKYSKEIEFCTEFMMSVVDVYKKHFTDSTIEPEQ